MENKKIIKIRKFPLLVVILILAGFLGIVSAQSFTSGYSPGFSGYSGLQYYRPSYQNFYSTSDIRTYWPVFGKEECRARQDFILSIAPGGCQPAVVRSDLLEEQNVPVFCRLDAIKVNPLIDIESIRSISFRGQYPNEISSIGFHPARAAVRSYNTLLGSPLVSNAGYVVIVLRRQKSEDDMPDWVEGNLTARIRYDMQNAFGVGKAEFLLPILSENEWEAGYEEYAFWRGKGFLRADWIDENKASISIYRDAYHKENSAVLREGQSSEELYLSGFYCQAAFNVRLNEITYPENKIKLTVQKEGEEQTLWLYEGSRFLDNKCSIREIKPLSLGGGSATIRCGSQQFILRLGTASSVNLEINGNLEKVKIWESVQDNYLAYVGEVPRNLAEDEGRTFVVLIKSSSEIENNKESLTTQIESRLEREVRMKRTKAEFETAAEASITNLAGIDSADIIFYGEGDEIKFVGSAGNDGFVYSGDSGEVLSEYFNKAISEYKDVVEIYPAEKENEFGDEIGIKALSAGIKLANDVGKQATKQELLKELVKNYPDTSEAINAKATLENTLKYNEYEAIESVPINFDYYTFQLQDIQEPTLDEISATISLDGEGVNANDRYTINDYVFVEEGKDPEFVQVKKIGDDFVEFRYSSTYKDSDNSERFTGIRTERVKLNELTTLGRFSVYVSDVKLTKVARVSLDPELKGPYSEANLSFKIGIEKRGIKLSPEKTQDMIDNLNESIEDWEDVSDKLKEVIKGWKGACYATSAMLLIKNLLDNFSGRSMARSRVMRGADGSGGWINRCKEMVASGEKGYGSLDQCLLGESDNIEKDVDIAHETIQNVNQMMENTEVVSENTIFGEKILKTEESFKSYMEEFKEQSGETEIQVYDEAGQIEKTVTMSDMMGDYNVAYEEGLYNFADVREWKFYSDMINSDISDDLKEEYKQKLSDTYLRIEERTQDTKYASGFNEQLVSTGLNLEVKGAYLEKNARADYWDGSYLRQSDLNDIDWGDIEQENKISLGEGERGYVQMIPYKGELYMLPLKEASGDRLVPTYEGYKVDASNNKLFVQSKLEREAISEILGREGLGISYFRKVEEGKCENSYKGPEVRFFDVEPFKGMPGVVPFDTNNGWYAGMKQTIKGFEFLPDVGGLTSYTESGLVRNFYLCNVGKNGREEFDSGIGDDICSFISFETGAEASHPCLKEDEARNMASKARNAIQSASRQYARGVREVTISGNRFKVGVPMGGSEGTQCQDFMSPEDCYLLFNTCDPVLCPPSRCNLGGNYHVRDVVQSGIIGSIVLCLPNAREGIFVPVCLTGVQAGIDSYISILKSHRDCLQESLETGRHVGLCDEIYSIYLCEFFWRQFQPLMDVFIPKMVELAYGQGTRGGGEYTTITHAWSTLDNSIEYFTDYYAQNAFRAFNLRTTDEVGTEVCKSFISARYPSNKDFFDKLLEPESPVQYHAWFNEIPFTEATLPPTSHYKVYYHIWAGNDIGSQYSVYLKEPPESSYYASSPRITIDTGYIPKGGYISNTEDFTAPASYKKLCVRVNLQEECGFGQVSTSFAVDYLKEQYAADVSTQVISTEKECMSGEPSVFSAVQPNLQGGIGEMAQPAIYKEGIIRICATDNPGKQTDPSRWKDVGYCDNDKVRCWLDTKSVKSNIRNKELLNETLDYVGDIDESLRKDLIESGEVISAENSLSKLEEVKINTNIKKAESVVADNAEELADDLLKKFNTELQILEDVEDRGFLNWHKAQAIFLRAQIYDAIAREVYEQYLHKSTTENIENEEVGEESEEERVEQEEETEQSIEQEKETFNIISEDGKDNLYLGDNYINHYLEESGGGYVIKEVDGGTLWFDLTVASIPNPNTGEIIINEKARATDKIDEEIYDLVEGYIFDETKKDFVKNNF